MKCAGASSGNCLFFIMFVGGICWLLQCILVYYCKVASAIFMTHNSSPKSVYLYRVLVEYKHILIIMLTLYQLLCQTSSFCLSNELLVIHRGLYEDLLQVPSLPETTQVDKLFEILERTFLAFGHYSSYLAGNRQQNIQVRAGMSS